MSDKKYPPQLSKVTVTFDDGEIKEFLMTAGPSIANYLASEARNLGTLVIRNDEAAHAIPYDRVREFQIELIEEKTDGE